jgi:hypothetical protein
MDTFLAQDWITATAGTAGAITLVQSEVQWLDLAAYRDVVAWLDVKRSSSVTIAVTYESAIAKEDSLFATMGLVNPLAGASLTVTPMLQDLQTGGANTAPLARWFRWKVAVPVNQDLVFRLWIAANKPGRAGLNRAASR